MKEVEIGEACSTDGGDKKYVLNNIQFWLHTHKRRDHLGDLGIDEDNTVTKF
jgi:hypothetical protein